MSSNTIFTKVIAKYREHSFSERDKGDRFERLIQAYLQSSPLYSHRLKKVWLWSEFPHRSAFGGNDTGIDIVAKTVTGEFWAVQCKCWAEEAVIAKSDVDTFLSTSGRKFDDGSGLKVGFSHRLFVATTNNWSPNAEEALKDQTPPVNRISLYDLENESLDWGKLEKGISGDAAKLPQKKLFDHQVKAVESAHEYYKKSDRGKLIMACGTGKTFTSLKIAEKQTNGHGFILFLVPSIALLGQTLREWAAEAGEELKAICVCSDSHVSKKRTSNDDSDSLSVIDLALPASTNVKDIAQQMQFLREKRGGITVVFSTYQSLDVVHRAQKQFIKNLDKKERGVFDLVICDEAHRTTGVALTAEDSSSFIKIHEEDFIQAKKRLYMTATPRLYSDDSKSKAKDMEAILCSMDDESLYGSEFYRIGFGEAVEKNLLSDYKVLILTISESEMPVAVQNMVADANNEINADDASKLIGCINALSKNILGDEGLLKSSDPLPMKKAVAFCQSIKISKKIARAFDMTRKLYYESLSATERERLINVEADHIDGTMAAPQRDEKMSWLKGTSPDTNDCRILTNVRCLSEGVDVPSLDAVLFLSAKNSQVDVVQSVGRVMRLSPGKKYGYIIIPVVVPANVEPDKALNDNERYKIVWTVLNALRAHDDRFNAIVNKIDLNQKKPDQILIGRIDNGEQENQPSDAYSGKDIASQLALQFEQLQSVLFARMVQKVGDRRYWEQWAKDVAVIAEKYIERIKRLVESNTKHKKEFENFLIGLQKNINPSVTADQAIEMLSQHIITKPVFEALFEKYAFAKNNAISVSMQKMLDLLEEQALEKDAETLTRFYESVRTRAAGIDNAEGRQKIVIELYDKFFKTAFPKMADQLGIVYTPVEVVDFIIQSVEVLLQEEFGRSVSDPNIHLLDPFTGTGTFITRLLQSGLIKERDLERKYLSEIHANELVLLAYYIAAINIENVYHDIKGEQTEFVPFDGIVLTDTFQMGETDDGERLFSEMFPQNSKRVQAQKKAPLRVIFGNPPYSVGQKSANDNAQNQSYPHLESRIAATYAADTDATNKNSLYDSYIKAFRWSTDRLDPINGGIIAFVSNGAWIDGNTASGFRKRLEQEFSSIHVFNLRGNARTSGESRRKEAGNVFGEGSRTPITLTFLVKNQKSNNEKAIIKYHDIGDYLTREEKLKRISDFGSIASADMSWHELKPDQHGDWLNQRSSDFVNFIPIAPDAKFSSSSKSYFSLNSRGCESGRDAWVYNFNLKTTLRSAKDMIAFYNAEVDRQASSGENTLYEPSRDPKKISWTSSLLSKLERSQKIHFNGDCVVKALYRPFCKTNLYFDANLIHRVGQMREMFSNNSLRNRVICVSGIGVTYKFSAIMTNVHPDLEFIGKSQCFPLFYFEETNSSTNNMFLSSPEVAQREGITDFILKQAQSSYGASVTKEDIFYYLYGVLHSPTYRQKYESDLKKTLPRIPLVERSQDFYAFSKAGRELADLHINYESIEPYPDVVVKGAEKKNFIIQKMRFLSKDDKSKIIFNSEITIENIPLAAYEYVVNGKSAIEWIMERYQVSVDKDSGIRNDPNEWATENPRYILDLLLSVVNVSMKTLGIMQSLPEF